MAWRRSGGRFSARLLVLAAGLFLSLSAHAARYAALVVEPASGRVLYEQGADEPRHPASLTKMMTLYLVFEALNSGRLGLHTAIRVSRYAASRPPSRLGLRPGDSLMVEDGILGLVTRSANDAAAALAEALGGSEPDFAEVMTATARRLGMNNTVYRNASGLPDPDQITTAWDQYRLARALQIDFPEHYGYFSTARFRFRRASYHNHNHLLENYPGTDGIKTGYIRASGFNLVASAEREGVRLIGILFGGDTAASRDAHMREILDHGFSRVLRPEDAGIRVAGLRVSEFPTPLRPPSFFSGDAAFERQARMEPAGGERQASVQSKKAVKPARKASATQRKATPARVQRAGGSREKSSWRIKVGTFKGADAARTRLGQVRKIAPGLKGAREYVSSYSQKGTKRYVAYFKGLSRDAANSACKALKRKNLACVPVYSSG